jgi:hypothetical protein
MCARQRSRGLFRAGAGLATGHRAWSSSWASRLGVAWASTRVVGVCWRRPRSSLAAPMLVLTLTPVAEAGVRVRVRPQAARAGEPEPPGAQGARAAGPGHLPPQHHHGLAGRERRPRVDRRQPAARAKLRVLPRHRQGSEPDLLRREPEGHQRARRSLAPQMSAVIIKRHVSEGPRDGAPVQAAAPRGRRDSSAPRHSARGLLLPQGAARARGQGERAAHRRVDLPLPRPAPAVRARPRCA